MDPRRPETIPKDQKCEAMAKRWRHPDRISQDSETRLAALPGMAIRVMKIRPMGDLSMLKILTATLALSVLAIPAKAESEVDRLCGTKVTWQAVKCAVALADARKHDIRAAEYEARAKHAEIDNRPTQAAEYRRRAAYEAAQGDAIRKLYH